MRLVNKKFKKQVDINVKEIINNNKDELSKKVKDYSSNIGNCLKYLAFKIKCGCTTKEKTCKSKIFILIILF